ncbi:MAG: tRNA pseudouridine(55) synthase TruB [Bacteroidota bacterium]
MTVSVVSRGAHELDWNGRGEVLLVDKSPDWTSFDVVKKTRSLFGIQKLGHAGTLDPQATGLLILCSGPKTKEIGSFADLDKCYTGTMELGIVSASFDGETEVSRLADPSNITEELLLACIAAFRGELLQTPPMYSAVKYGGRPLYKYARAGKTVERTARKITVSEFEVTRYKNPLVEFRVRCSKGTYIRSLVNDIGEKLGCGAVLRVLRRTAIGSYKVDDAMTIDELTNLRNQLGESPKTNADSAATS